MNWILAPQDFLHPELSVSAQAAFRVGYALLLLGTLFSIATNWRFFFVSEKWGGYGDSARLSDRLVQSPAGAWIIFITWIAAVGLMLVNRWVLPAAFLNLLYCYYFFIRLRWRSLLRGMGAPGFMSWWCGAAVFFLELANRYAPGAFARVLLAFQLDFAFIMLSAGVYKWTAGYPSGSGMELGMVNPMWGYWGKFYGKLPSDHFLFFTLNQLAWTTEVLSGVLMMIPATRLLGAFMIAASFLFILTHIRLGLLCEMVILCCFLFFYPGSLPDRWFPTVSVASSASVGWLESLLNVVFTGYIFLRPLVLSGLWFNFYGKRRFPGPIQAALDIYANLFGIILWRVFTADVTNFLIEVEKKAPTGARTRLSRYENPIDLRFNQVSESIAVTTIFTALKYFSSNRKLFEERLLRYSRTLPCRSGEELLFTYICIVKENGGFHYVPAREFSVDPRAGLIRETVLDARVQIGPAAISPVNEGIRPGSYLSERAAKGVS